jgi:tetratricopeptide (TPR) repeat protein
MNINKLVRIGLCVYLLFHISNVYSQSFEELMSTGNGLLSNGAYTEAITVFRKALSREPSNFEAQSNLAFAYLKAERYSNAVTEYNKAISLNPRSAICWLNLGYAYDNLGKRSKAVESINHSIQLDPGNVDGRMTLAAFHEDAKAYDKAIAQYEAVIKIGGVRREEAYSNIARCLLEKGDVAGAKKYLNDALAANSNNATAHWQLGNILWKKENKREEAIIQYKTATSLNPNASEFYENYALLLEEMNRVNEAIAVWKTAMIYTNEALKKDEIQARINKLESGGSTVPVRKDLKLKPMKK